jgi:hypothetical protein
MTIPFSSYSDKLATVIDNDSDSKGVRGRRHRRRIKKDELDRFYIATEKGELLVGRYSLQGLLGHSSSLNNP